jgi:hypothetical protein
MDKRTAYHEWLGIPKKNESPNYYELLGIPLFETNLTVISNGAVRRNVYLQTMFASEFAELAQDIQKEVAKAKIALLNEKSRLDYENRLKRQIEICDMGSKHSVASSIFSLSVDIADGALDAFVDETRNLNNKLAQQTVWLIGSGANCDIVVKNKFVSRKHCFLFRRDRMFQVEDWNSTNGTFVNERRLPPRTRTVVNMSDIVTLGKVTQMPWPPIHD